MNRCTLDEAHVVEEVVPVQTPSAGHNQVDYLITARVIGLWVGSYITYINDCEDVLLSFLEGLSYIIEQTSVG